MSEIFVGHDFGLLYVVSQFFALVGTILSLLSVQQKKKVQILNYNTLASASAILHYLFLGAWTGVAIKIVSATRNATAAYAAHKQKKPKVLPFVFVIFYAISGCLTYESVFSLLPTFGVIVFTVVIYLGEAKTIRYVAGFCSLMWLIYNVYVFSLVGVVSELVYIGNDLAAIYRYRKPKRKIRG
ncbi:YgjV family protein [Candidatus Saccharibacteria bacterium]|nr:YgjV family protein [Candidatus Saccharibacteria bacterium]